jgi:formate dehydrogenase beta subunit
MKDSKRKKQKYSSRGRRADGQSLQTLKQLLGEQPLQRELLIEYLHKIQDEFKHLSAGHLTALADLLKISIVEVFEVASFYHHFDVVDENSKAPAELTIRVCDSISCQMNGADELIQSLQNEAFENVRIQRVPCVGRCDKAPVAMIDKYPVESADLDKIKQIKSDRLYEVPLINLINTEKSRDSGAYAFVTELQKNFDEAKKEQIISELETSNLRGLGGAGFPVGRKWRILSSQIAPRTMAVNIDEGEPGTFKDHYYLQKDPQQFIEGMLIAALTVDIDVIYIYLRDEYPACHAMLELELEKLKANPPYSLPEIHLRRGAGAYICGEESAMIESIEGKRGMPRLRPPYVAEVGVHGRPTLVQNMETLYWVRDIVAKGTEWFTTQGRHGRTGMRSFSVSGRVNKPGVHFAPAGITLQELIDEYCGGMLEGHKLYGYLPGGASGGILPASKADIPLDFDTLNDHGCFIGSAAVIVFSDADSARQIAANAMHFFEHESCGQCTPCRVGTAKAVKLMQQEIWDTELMQELSTVMRDASICGLGQAAPNPMDCVIKYFPDEINGSKS